MAITCIIPNQKGAWNDGITIISGAILGSNCRHHWTMCFNKRRMLDGSQFIVAQLGWKMHGLCLGNGKNVLLLLKNVLFTCH